MIKALMLIFIPGRTWNGLAEDKRGILSVLFLYLVPLLAMVYFAEAYGLAHWGKERGSGLPALRKGPRKSGQKTVAGLRTVGQRTRN